MKLTTRSVETLKVPDGVKGAAWEVFDEGFQGASFGVCVSRRTSRKTFILRVAMPDGRRQRFTLGRFPDVGLAEARKRARAVLTETDRGRDLTAEAKQRREAPTFKDLAETFLASPRMRQRAPKTRKEYRRMLDNDLLPAWGQHKAHSLAKADVSAILDRVAARGEIAANRVRALMSVIFNFGLDRDIVDSNPALAVRKPAPERKRDRMLSESDIQPFWLACEADGTTAARLLQFILVTGQRKGETTMARWDDLEEDLWRIPGENTKNGRPHAVPLSPQALSVLQPLRENPSPWIFPSPVDLDRCLVNCDRCARRISKKIEVKFSPHDLRRTLTTGCAQQGVSSDVLARILNHTPQGVLAHYDHADRMEDVRRALLLWGSKVESLVTGKKAKVLKIG